MEMMRRRELIAKKTSSDYDETHDFYCKQKLTINATRTIRRATIRTVCLRASKECCKKEKDLHLWSQVVKINSTEVIYLRPLIDDSQSFFDNAFFDCDFVIGL